jgi:hypothetical protein
MNIFIRYLKSYQIQTTLEILIFLLKINILQSINKKLNLYFIAILSL